MRYRIHWSRLATLTAATAAVRVTLPGSVAGLAARARRAGNRAVAARCAGPALEARGGGGRVARPPFWMSAFAVGEGRLARRKGVI